MNLLKCSFRYCRVGAALAVLSCVQVSYAEPVIVGGLHATPSVIPIGSVTRVSFIVKIDDPSYISGSALLHKVTETGSVIATLGKLHDDGVVGDLVANDGIFTLVVTMEEPAAATRWFEVSAAFKGSLLRSKSFVASIEANSDAAGPVPLATAYPDRLVFTDPKGKIILNTPIKSEALDDVISEVRTWYFEDAHISSTGECAALFSTEEKAGYGNDTAETTYSALRYFCQGQLLWKREAVGPFELLHDRESTLLSRNGKRVLFISDIGSSMPSIEVLEENGGVIFSRKGDILTINKAQISKNGRFIYLEGNNSDGLVAQFYDVDQNSNWTFVLNFDLYQSLEIYENDSGSFSVFGDDVTLFVVPAH